MDTESFSTVQLARLIQQTPTMTPDGGEGSCDRRWCRQGNYAICALVIRQRFNLLRHTFKTPSFYLTKSLLLRNCGSPI